MFARPQDASSILMPFSRRGILLDSNSFTPSWTAPTFIDQFPTVQRNITLQNVSTSACVIDEAIKLPVFRQARP